MKRNRKRVNLTSVVKWYRQGDSLRAIARRYEVSQTTMATWLKSAGVPRRRTEQHNQQRWPRLECRCARCGASFARRQAHRSTGEDYCSRRCYYGRRE